MDDGVTTSTPLASAAPLDLSGGPFASMRRVSALDTVRARIAMAVDLGLLVPGERLPAASEIAEALDVGEITVRRALVSLCQAGVLERRRGRDGGTLVAPEPVRGAVREVAAYEAAAQGVRQLIDQRVVIECGITHLAALNASREHLDALNSLVTRLDESTIWTEFHQGDEAFHRLLSKACGYPSATASLEAVTRRLYRYFLPYPMEYLHRSNDEHRQLVVALDARDAVTAVDIARRHIEELHHSMFMGLIEAWE